MEKLPKDWLTQGWVDFEHKKYVILAYLQQVQQNFTSHKLFPDLPELRAHCYETQQLQQSKGQINAAFPKNLSGIDGAKRQLTYQPTHQDDAFLTEIDHILGYALPLFQQTLARGQNQYADIEAQITFLPVGIVPLHLQDGYLFIYRARLHQTDVYQYQIRLFENQVERSVHTTYLQTIHKSAATTFEGLKLSLVRQRRELPNPATYLVESPGNYPVQEALLPIAKRLIVKHTIV